MLTTLLLFAGSLLAAAMRSSFFVIAAKAWDPETSARAMEGLTLASAVVAPCFIFFGGGLKHIVATLELDAAGFRPFLFARMKSATFASVLSVLALAGVGELATIWTLVGVTALRFAEAMAEMTYGQLQAHKKFHAIGLMKSIRAVVAIAAFATCVGFGAPFSYALVATACCSWLIFSAIELPYVSRVTHRSEQKTIAIRPMLNCVNTAPSLGWSVASLDLSMALTSLGTALPSLFLSYYASRDALATYGALLCFVAAQQMLFVSYGQYLLPRFVELERNGRPKDVRQILSKAGLAFLLLSLAMAGIAYLGSDIFLPIIFSERFHGLGGELAAMLISGGVLGVFSIYGTALTAAHIHVHQIAMGAIYFSTCALLLLVFSLPLTIVQIAFSTAAASASAALTCAIIRTCHQQPPAAVRTFRRAIESAASPRPRLRQSA